MTSTDQNYDVLVVGAGPAGLTTAASLARAGVRVLVVEKHRGLSIFPKAIGVRPRSMEIMRSWGLEAEVVRRSQRGRVTMRVGPALSRPGQEVGLGLPDDEVLKPVTPVGVALCGQDQLEAVLLDHAVAHGGQVRFRTELINLVETSDGVEATLQFRDNGEITVVRSRYLVGADGGRSIVRSLMEIDFEMLGSEGDHLSILFRADLSSVMSDPPYVLNVIMAPEFRGLFASTAMADRWVYDMEWHPEAGERVEDWTTERITARLRADSGLPDLEPEIVGVFPWDFGAGVARHFRRGRVFLVGDAAHRTTPRGATGMNTGIADGHNLGWKLAFVIKGWAAEGLLDSYEAEREPVGRANATASLQTMAGRPPSDGLAHDFGVSYTSAAIVGGSALAGQRAPHAWVQPLRALSQPPRALSQPPRALSQPPRALSLSKGQSSSISTIDLFDGQFTLLTGSAGSDWRSAAEGLADQGMPLSVFTLGVDLGDPTGELAARYELGNQGAVVIRPDGYVTWGSDDPSAARLQDALHLATGHRVADLVS